MSGKERSYYRRRHVCSSCGRIRRFNPLYTLCNFCAGSLRAGIVKGTERRVPRFWGLSHRWEEDLASEVYFRWEDDEKSTEMAGTS